MVNVNVIGRLGSDAEILNGKNGEFVAFRLAVTDFNEGEKTTVWFRVTAFDERTKRLSQYLKKGSLVNVIGTEGVRIYKDRNGEPQIGRDIKLNTFDFISVSSNSENKEGHVTSEVTEKPTTVKAVPEPKIDVTPKAVDASVDDTDDLPF